MSDTPTLLSAAAVVPMAHGATAIADGAVLIEGGIIRAVGRREELRADRPEATHRAMPGCILMPGLINAHAHSGMLRGTAEHLPVWQWLAQHINPMHRVLNPAEAEAASYLCYAEALLSGTTTIVDMWRHMDGSAKAAETLGNRLVAVPYVGAHPDYDYFESLDANEAMIETWNGAADGRITVWVGLEHLFYSDAAGQRRAIDLAQRHKTGFHTHASEAEIEIAEFARRYGKRPIHVLDDLGFFSVAPAMLAHAVWLEDDEITLLAERGVSVAHNPVSNMKLASGMAPVEEYLRAGVAVGIGTDGEKENNNFCMFEEMKVASLLGKLRHRDAAAMDSADVLAMATIGGARALGMERTIGSLEPGKRADIIAVRKDTPRLTPFFADGPYANIHHNLVHAVRGSDVEMVMVDGRVVVDNGALVAGDLADILATVSDLAPGLFARRAAWLADNPVREWSDSAETAAS